MKSQGNMEFPKFNCICELCNCGRHKHHKGCSKRNAETRISWGSSSCLLSHYRATFTWPHKRKRSTRKPQLTLPPVNQLSRQHLFSPQARQTPGPANKSLVTPLEEPDTTAKSGTSLQDGPAQEAPRCNTSSSCCSYMYHRGAPYSNSFPRLGELPAVIGSLLYPDQREKMETTTNREFIPKTGGRPGQTQVVQCNLMLEGYANCVSDIGERDLATTHREEFKPYPLEGAPAARRRCAPVKEEEEALKGAPMESVTRYSYDFPPRPYPPKRRNPARPQPDNLTINPTLRSEFRTVQMDTYPGWDTLEHRRPAPARLREELSFRKNDEHFQGDTVTKLAFQPLPLPSHHHKAKPLVPTLKPLSGPFDDRTANREFFKDWGVHRRVRHGDLYDGAYLKPVGKFESETTNSQTFFGMPAERVKNCKPQHRPVEHQGQHTFATEHQEAYRPLSLPVCQLQLYLSQNLPTNKEQLASPALQT